MPAAPSPFLGSVPRVDINNRVEGRAPPESPPSLSAPAPRYFTVHPPNQMRQGLSGGEAAGNSSFLRPARVMRVQSHPALTAKSSGGGEAGGPQLCLRGSLPRLSGASPLPPSPCSSLLQGKADPLETRETRRTGGGLPASPQCWALSREWR